MMHCLSQVNLNCWNSTEEMTSWMTENNFGLDAEAYYGQWSVFQEKARRLLTAANKNKEVPGILWTSHLTEEGRADRYLSNSHYIIQIWTTGADQLIGELLRKNYRVIFSNYDAWYLDCGAGAWVGEGNNWCSPYKGWQKVYDNSPHQIALNLTGSTHINLVLGGEAALWSEQVDEAGLDAKVSVSLILNHSPCICTVSLIFDHSLCICPVSLLLNHSPCICTVSLVLNHSPCICTVIFILT